MSLLLDNHHGDDGTMIPILTNTRTGTDWIISKGESENVPIRITGAADGQLARLARTFREVRFFFGFFFFFSFLFLRPSFFLFFAKKNKNKNPFVLRLEFCLFLVSLWSVLSL